MAAEALFRQSGVPLKALRVAMEGRLREAHPHLTGRPAEPGASAVELLRNLVDAVRAADDASSVWLLLVAVTGRFPSSDWVSDVRSRLRMATADDGFLALLDASLEPASVSSFLGARIEIVWDRPVIDVDFCARFGFNSGIQRVVLETMPRWQAAHDIVPVAWTEDGTAMRTLRDEERLRVFDWTSARRREGSPNEDPDDLTIVVPWKTTVVCVEVASFRACEQLEALAALSGNSVTMVGYDTIPVVDPDFVSADETERFARYLAIVKHADQVVGISEAASAQFAGFISTLAAQGLTGPLVTTVPLPVGKPRADTAMVRNRELLAARRMVLSVGTHERRKNQVVLLEAAERLWRDGVEFDLVFIGASGLSDSFDEAVRALRRRIRPVHVLRHAGDAELAYAFQHAEFSVFVSLHEGYGLPVAESLAFGTPVLASNYGSVAEVAALGGCVTVDPRSPGDIAAEMARLLSNPEELTRLRAEIDGIPRRGWDEYAKELWDQVVRVP